MFVCLVVGICLSRETVELCAMIQAVVELQRVLWLYRSILNRQALLQLLQVKVVPSCESREPALCCLSSLPIAVLSTPRSFGRMPSVSFSSHKGLQPVSPSLLDIIYALH